MCKKLEKKLEKLYGKKIKQFDWLEWVDVSNKRGGIALTEEFIRKYQNNVNWVFISFHCILSEDFMRDFKDKLFWEWIVKMRKLSGKFIDEIKNDDGTSDKINEKLLSKQNKINYLKYKLKHNKISNEMYLKELLKCTQRN